MATTTNFEEWLAQVDPNKHEVRAVYYTVTGEESQAPFELSKSTDKLFVKYPDADTLMITARAKNVFVDILQKKYCDGMDVESWYGLECALEREERKEKDDREPPE